MSAHSDTLDQVLRWIHQDKAIAVKEDFWKNAADRIGADVWNLDATVPGWDEAHALANPSLWFYACLREGRVWAEDDEGVATAEAAYQVALALANGQVKQGAGAQLARPAYD